MQRFAIRISILFAFLCATSSVLASAIPSKMTFQHSLTQPGSSDNAIGEINAITQDPKGFIWIGGELGLLRYDGHEYKTFNFDGKPIFGINDLHVDKQGTFWVGTSNGLLKYSPQSESFELQFQGENLLSSETVYSITSDEQSNLYIGTYQCLNIYTHKTQTLLAYCPDSEGWKDVSRFNKIKKLLLDETGKIWMATGGALVLLDPTTSVMTLWERAAQNSYQRRAFYVRHYPVTNRRDRLLAVLPPQSQEELAATDAIFSRSLKGKYLGAYSNSVVIDKNNIVWSATESDGLVQFMPETNKVIIHRHNKRQPRSLKTDKLKNVFLDHQERLWVLTDEAGLQLHIPNTNYFKNYRHDPAEEHSINSNKLRSIYQDNGGNLWIGAFPQGLNFYNGIQDKMRYLYHSENNINSLSDPRVLSIHESSTGDIWIATEKGINRYNWTTGQYKRFTTDTHYEAGLVTNSVTDIAEDSDGNIWFGSWSGGLYKLNPTTEQFTQFKHEPDDQSTLSSHNPWTLLMDGHNLWVGALAGFGASKLDKRTQEFERYSYTFDRSSRRLHTADIFKIMKDSDGVIWAVGPSGASYYDPEQDTFLKLDLNLPDTVRLVSMAEDNDRNLWLGSWKEGIHILSMDKRVLTKHLTKKDGLPSNSITSLALDQDARMWAGTTYGLAEINSVSHSVRAYYTSNGLIGDFIDRDAILVDRAGRIYVGSRKGVTVFTPNSIEHTQQNKPVTLTTFKLQDIDAPIDPNSLLKTILSETAKIELAYDFTSFEIGFSALDFANKNINYAYRLDGLENEWQDSGSTNLAKYTGLGPGKYTFAVKSKGGNEIWSDPTILNIYISPPWWKTIWAYLFYTLAALIIIFIYIRLKTRTLKREAQQQKRINHKLKQIDELKNSFLANISHELLTPLNGIIGSCESLITSPNLSEKDHILVNHIENKGKKLSYLVDDLLDFTSLTNRKLKFNIRPEPIKNIISEVDHRYRSKAEAKGLIFSIQIDDCDMYALIDKDKAIKILSHIVSNAMKYTQQGEVSLSVSKQDGVCSIKVLDTGIGISNMGLLDIFTSFHQLDHRADRSYAGVGLGLPLVKILVELHKGTIDVSSEKGKGSCFDIKLPLANQIQQDAASSQEPLEHWPQKNSPIQKILIVDDDPLNRMVLSAILQKESFVVLEAENGQKALNIFKNEKNIDLVILDIMMPEMNGIEVCKKLRAFNQDKNIPIIFLSARPKSEMYMESQDVGGKKYLTKPIDREKLMSCMSEFDREHTAI